MTTARNYKQMKPSNYFSLKFVRTDSSGENDKLTFLDQTKLPLEENYIQTNSYERIAEAIEKLEIRGAPLIGIAVAYALALAVKSHTNNIRDKFDLALKRLSETRPTAVNLFSALDTMKEHFLSLDNPNNAYESLLNKAKDIHRKDEEYCSKIGKNGLAIFKKKSNVLTHCNTGKLATGGDGTAFNVIKTAFENDLVNFVYANETRPLLQGLRLTAFELEKCSIPFALQTDSSAAFLMKQTKIDLVVTGADRIALNGDSANKIGTYNLAILSYYHNIPFYVAAPSTTFDRTIATGDEIEIEFRSNSELVTVYNTPIASKNYDVFNPAFDITPSHLITGIITEEGLFNFPYNFLR